MPTDKERLATLEAEVRELKHQLAAGSSWVRWAIGTIIAAAAAYGAVLSAEIMRKG